MAATTLCGNNDTMEREGALRIARCAEAIKRERERSCSE